MPDRRRHRGPHPADAELFGPAWHAPLRAAASDLSWLLSRGYAATSALKLVGDRHRLRERQRTAVLRSSCTEAARVDRAQRQVDVAAVAGADLLVDGYNALITVEAALAGGVLLLGQDGCLRDLASLHGHFKRVEETLPALTLLGEAIADWGIQSATLLLDRPVSNSGRLAERMRDLAAESGWPWSVEVVADPDRELKVRAGMVATSDSVVLDRCGIWFNLAYEVVAQRVPGAAWIAFDNP